MGAGCAAITGKKLTEAPITRRFRGALEHLTDRPTQRSHHVQAFAAFHHLRHHPKRLIAAKDFIAAQSREHHL